MNWITCRSRDEYRETAAVRRLWRDRNATWIAENWKKFSQELSFSIRGFSFTANGTTDFFVQLDQPTEFHLIPWREQLVCRKTSLNSRMRAAVFVLIEISRVPKTARIWVTEQVTPLYAYLKNHFSDCIASEFLGDAISAGAIDTRGVRNESVTRSSFAPASLDAIFCLEVLEHVPNFEVAFKEFHRVLRSGGKLVFSAPFLDASFEHEIRAVQTETGILHLKPAEYHGDPNSGEPILCYQYFGWKILEDLREAGFKDASVIALHSIGCAHPGNPIFVFSATR